MNSEGPPSPRVLRAGFAAIQGARHRSLPEVRLDAHGPVGDREWCLVDPGSSRVLSTVATPLMHVLSDWDGERLRVLLPDCTTVVERPTPSAPALRADYWGRAVKVVPHAGVVSAALSEIVERPAVLCRARRGDIVYGDSVTIIGTATLADLATRMGEQRLASESERFRSTFLVETTRPTEEDEWLGRQVRLGEAVVEVTGLVGRCAVPNLDPRTGARDLPVLKQLTSYRPMDASKAPCLAIEARVVAPGVVRVCGDRAMPPDGSVDWPVT